MIKYIVAGFLCLLIASNTLAKVKTIEIYPNITFIEEVFELYPGKHEIPLLASVPYDQVNIHLNNKKFKIVSLSFKKGKNICPLAQKLKNLKREKEKIISKIKILEKKISLLETTLSGKKDIPSFSSFEEYLNFLDTLQQSIEIEKEKLSSIEKEISSIKNKIVSENTTLVTLTLTGPKEIKTQVFIHYPARKILSVHNIFEVHLNTISQKVLFFGKALIIQRSCEDWQNVTFLFYPRQKPFVSITPPPFSPWYVDLEAPVRFRKMLKSKALVLSEGFKVIRETSPSSIWERLKIEKVTCPAGEEITLWLVKEELLATKFAIEVPAYTSYSIIPYFRADLVPKISIPETNAMFYVDGTYVGMGHLPRLLPGKKATLYFGEAHLMEVKREILKDTTGKAHIFGSREKIEKIFKTTIINHYTKKMPIILVDRIPISRRKEIKISVKANPQWDDLSPEGKVTWYFDLEPEEKKEVILQIEIVRPKKEQK